MATKPSEQQQRDDMKTAFKEALKEWLDEKFATVGIWSVRGIVSMVLVAVTYIALQLAGWKPPLH